MPYYHSYNMQTLVFAKKIEIQEFQEMLEDLDLICKQASMTMRFQLQNDMEEYT